MLELVLQLELDSVRPELLARLALLLLLAPCSSCYYYCSSCHRLCLFASVNAQRQIEDGAHMPSQQQLPPPMTLLAALLVMHALARDEQQIDC